MIRDVKEIQESTIWQTTGQQLQNKKQSLMQQSLKTIVFIVGQRHSGKSSFLKIVKNDFDPQTKPNAFVEYHYSKIGREKKHYLHFYEIGNKNLLPLIDNFIRKKDTKVIVAVCVDLSKPRNIVAQALTYFNKIKELTGTGPDQKLRNQHEDNQFISTMPATMVLVGCKWDIFEKMDQQSKKWVSRAWRYLAHTHCASILTTSNKNNTLSLNLRSGFVQFLLGQQNATSKNIKEYNKPLFVKFGEDHISEMNLPSSSMTNLQVLQKQLQSTLPADPKKKEANKASEEVESSQGKLEEALRAKRKEMMRFFKTDDKSAKEENNFV